MLCVGTDLGGSPVTSSAIVNPLSADLVDGQVSMAQLMALLLADTAGKTIVNETAHTMELIAQDNETVLATLSYDSTTPGQILSSSIG
jgi:hypothetical protein